MTNPSGGYPGGAANTPGQGLSAWSQKSAAQWKNETTAPMKNSYENNFFGSWVSNLFGGFFNGVLGLISALVFGLKGITGGLIDLTGALKATDTKATNAVNTANGAVQTVVNVQKEVIQKIAVFDIRSPTPGYVAINGTEWPSIPHSDLEMGATVAELGTFHETGTQQGTGTAHTHRDNHTHATTLTRVPEKQLVAAQQWFAFIRIPIDTPLSGLNFYARGLPTDLRTRVYSVSPTGDLTALTPESPNLAGLLVNTQHTSTPTNFEDALVEAGTWVCVRFRVVGTVYIAGAEKFAPERPEGFYPRQLSATTALASGTVSPDSIPESSLTWPAYPSGFVPYVAVGNNIVVAQPKRYYSDNGDRADTSVFPNIGDNWSIKGPLQSSGLYIRSNAFAWSGGDNGVNTALYRSPLTTDKAYSTIHLGAPASATATTAWSRFLMRSNSNCTSGIAFAFKVGAMELQNMTAYNTFTTQIPLSRAWAVGDKIDMQVGTDANVNEVIVWHNDIEIVRTVMTQTSGPGFRYGGIGVSRTPFQSSPPILDWLMYDIPDVEPAA